MNDLDLSRARTSTAALADLLRREHAALADFLVALAAFDRAGTYRLLGYASLFDFLHRELHLSRGAAHYRKVAARLVAVFPEVVEPLRDGRLCLSAVLELAKVMTRENAVLVLPRFFHCSKQEAREVAVQISPAEIVPTRTVVAVVRPALPARLEASGRSVHPDEPASPGEATTAAGPIQAGLPRTTVDPVTPGLRRLHLTVSPEFVSLLRKARAGQSHVQPGATDEQVLTAALQLLLEEQARRRARVPPRVKREVARRDGGRCQWPTHDGGTCGSELRLEVDHVVPLGKGGPSTAENCRLLCDRHNQEAARRACGDAHMDRFAPDPVAREGCAGYSAQDPGGRPFPVWARSDQGASPGALPRSAPSRRMSRCPAAPWERRAASW